MGSEFLMPLKYQDIGCGLTVAIFGLNSSIRYNNMVIYIEGIEHNKYHVNMDVDNNFRTTSATFCDLKENTYYNVVAELYVNDEMIKIQAKIPSSVMVNNGQAMFKSLRFASTTPKQYLGGGFSKPAPQCKGQAIGR